MLLHYVWFLHIFTLFHNCSYYRFYSDRGKWTNLLMDDDIIIWLSSFCWSVSKNLRNLPDTKMPTLCSTVKHQNSPSDINLIVPPPTSIRRSSRRAHVGLLTPIWLKDARSHLRWRWLIQMLLQMQRDWCCQPQQIVRDEWGGECLLQV